jgi:TadE-like protein
MGPLRGVHLRSPGSGTSAGQSVVEFALVLPLMLLLVVGIADLGRLYTSAIAVQDAAREAADLGAFTTNYWATISGRYNGQETVERMEERACVSAAGSHLEGYVEGPVTPGGHRTCANPSFVCTLETTAGQSADCISSGGIVASQDCSNPTTEPPCLVHVRMEYNFATILALPLVPQTVDFARDSRYSISALPVP